MFSQGTAAVLARPYSLAPPFLPPSLILLPLVRLKLLVAPQNHQATQRNSPGFLATSPIAELWEVVFVTEKEGTGWGWEWELKAGGSRRKRYKRGMESGVTAGWAERGQHQCGLVASAPAPCQDRS